MMKQFIGFAFASAIVVNVNAQSAQDGYKLIQYGKYNSAIEAMSKIADNNPEAAYVLGLAHIEKEDFAAARQAFAKHPTDFFTLAGQAQILIKEGKVAQAEPILQGIVDKAKKKDWERYKVAADAINYGGAGNVTNAEQWYLKSLEIKKDVNAYVALGDLYQYRMQNRGGDAMTNYESAEKLNENQSLVYSKIANLWLRSRNYEKALDYFTKAKDADTQNPLPYKSLASAYNRAGQTKIALENIEKYLQLSEQSTKDKIDYANILLAAKEYDKAATVLNDLLSANLNEPTLYRALAYTQFEQKKYNEALASLDRFFKENSNAKYTADDYLYKGKINIAIAGADTANAASYIATAEKDLETALTMVEEADKLATYTEIADIYKGAGSWKEAGEWYGKVLNAKGEKATAFDYYNAGLYAYYGKEYQKSFDIFTAMKNKFTDEGTAYYWVARAAETLDPEGDKGTALVPYQEWLAFSKEGYTPATADIVRAYQYIGYYYYKTDKIKESKEYIAKILTLDPANKFANSMNDYFKKIK